LAFLPLHAAGLYDDDAETSSEKAYHYVISSYAPNFSTLIERDRSPTTKFRGLLAISQPATPGQNPLPGTVTEVKAIFPQMSEEHFEWLNAEKATVSAVLEGMSQYNWIHLACHGIQDQTDPMKSAFMLYDGGLDLRAISGKPLPNAELAFLSACQTATGDENLPEEAVHLAAGMLMAGYRSVIATMWSIRDADAPTVAEEVYKQLVKEMTTSNGQVAYALHKAVECLRQKRGEREFLSWIPFVHLGI
jgi:CHAT domain-containing protein